MNKSSVKFIRGQILRLDFSFYVAVVSRRLLDSKKNILCLLV